MGLEVIIDDSLEGVKLKKELECDEIQSKLHNFFNIRWGNWLDKENHGLIFNSPQAVKNSIDKENVILTLRKNHVNCPKRIKPGKKTEFPIMGRKYNHVNGNDIKIIDSFDEYKRSDSDYFLEYINLTKEYRVHVIDLEAFFIEEKYIDNNDWLDMDFPDIEPIVRTSFFGWKLKEIEMSLLSSNIKKIICDLARKAVYALGLDFGVVNIGKTSQGKYYVLDVDATCKEMSEKCENEYIYYFTKTLFKYDDLINGKEDITIGADPECLIKDKDTGELIFASDFFTKKGSFGLDNRSIESQKKYYPLLEIRPNYSTNPIEVVNSIEEILRNVCQYIHYKNIGLYSGSMPIYNYWVGGHIHFGIKPNTKLLKALDNYLALPIMMIEKEYSARQRKIKYGILGNCRLKCHGGFEYCTLSSWLISPEICKGILCLSKVIVQEYLNLKEEFLCSYSDIRAFYLVNKSYFKDKISNIISNISNTNTFKIYSSYIEPLFKRILSVEVWNEDEDIRKNWNINTSNEIYKISYRCFIPEKKRVELNIELEDTITLMIDKNKYKVKVYPKDDFSIEKNSYVSFSADICNKIGIKESESVAIYFDSRDSMFKVGPILGIFSYVDEHAFGPFGYQSYYFRKLIKLSKNKGIISYVFTIDDANWDKGLVRAYTYDFDTDQWVIKHFPLPDVIYDRGDVVCEENYGNKAVNYIYYTKKNNIKFINTLDCINLTNDKLETYLLLNSNDATRKYQVLTEEYNSDKQLKQFTDEHGHIFLKLKKGCRSKGIFSVEKVSDNYYEIIHRTIYPKVTKFEVEAFDLIETINEEIKKIDCTNRDYLMQKAISLAKYKNQNFEVRVVMQKNSEGIWFRTCMIARVAGEEEKFLNPSTEVDLKSSQLLSQVFGDESKSVIIKLRNASKDIVEVIDNNNIQSGELAIDFGIDENLNIFVIELNSKPDNLLSAIGAYKMRNLSIYRILEYTKFLAYNSLDDLK